MKMAKTEFRGLAIYDIDFCNIHKTHLRSPSLFRDDKAPAACMGATGALLRRGRLLGSKSANPHRL